MDASKLGVVTPGGEGQGAGTENEGQHSESKAGTGDDTTKSQHQPEGEGNNDGAGNGEGGEAGDPKDKRINDLMSKWQTEEAGHKKTKSELELYKEKFGSLDGDGKPAPKARKAPDIDEGDEDLPQALQAGWQPKTMEELQEGLRQAALYGARIAERNITEKTLSAEQARKEAEQQIDDFVAEVKQVDPEFNDKVFFEYATEHGFPVSSVKDLRAVYSSFVSLERAKRGAVETALKNKDARKNPVGKPGSGQGNGSAVPFSKIQQATSAKDLISDMIHNRK